MENIDVFIAPATIPDSAVESVERISVEKATQAIVDIYTFLSDQDSDEASVFDIHGLGIEVFVATGFNARVHKNVMETLRLARDLYRSAPWDLGMTPAEAATFAEGLDKIFGAALGEG